MSRITRPVLLAAAASLGLLGSLSCSTVALTGRHQLTLVPESEMLSVSSQQYGQFLSENKVSADPRATPGSSAWARGSRRPSRTTRKTAATRMP